MPETPLISVVIPTRNRPTLVLRAVATALGQTYPRVEVVVVVDGSDPGSVAALQSLQDQRVRIIPLAENVGGSEARNTGVRESNGDWIAFLDDDDEWLPQKLEKQMALVNSLSDKRVLVSCRFTERSAGGSRTYPLRLPDPFESLDDYMCRPRGFRTGGELLQTSTFLAPKNLLSEVPFVRGLKRGQEFIWLVQAGSWGGATLHVHPETLSFFNAATFSDEARISNKPNWRSFYQTLQHIERLFRPGVYAYCIATRLLTDAILCKEPTGVKLSLLRDCLTHGGLSPRCVLTFLYIWLIPSGTRRKLGERLRRLVSAPFRKPAQA